MNAHVRRLGLIATVTASLLAVHAEENCVPKHYKTGASRVEGKLNVHLVPHTHDDPGWLKTVDQYYYGANQTIQMASVQYILDTVTTSLEANKDRRFVYGEMAFFTRWWDEQDEEVRAMVKKLVNEGRLVFVNGGWVQHDEASTHYVAMIDQTTRGHRFLNDTFGIIPSVGWQIDPFGHSSTHASLMVASLGFDAVFFGRADYQDMEQRAAKKQLEVVWRPSHSFGRSSDVFTSNFASGNYGPPTGFMFEYEGPDPPIMDSACLDGNNVAERVEAFVQQAHKLSNVTYGDDIIFTMGSDFTYSNANVWFKNMDKLIHHVNEDGRINVFYSTPAAYLKAKNSYSDAWPVKEDDFFPYADGPHNYWTGYYTSRASSKGYIRWATAYLQAARQLDFLSRQRLGWPVGNATETLEEAVSLTQHHDAITGTAKQAVADDYNKRIAKGVAHAEVLVLGVLSEMIYGKNEIQKGNDLGQRQASEEDPTRTLPPATKTLSAEADQNASGSDLGLSSCHLANVSVCTASVVASRKGNAFIVVAYNPVAWTRTQGLRVPVVLPSPNTTFAVTGPDGAAVPSQLIPVSNATLALQRALTAVSALPDPLATATHELAFLATTDALSYAAYAVRPMSGKSGSASVLAAVEVLPIVADAPAHMVTLGSADGARLEVNKGAGTISMYRSAATPDTQPGSLFTPQVVAYASGNSGAYIFSPGGFKVYSAPTSASVVDGPVVTEFRQVFSAWASLVTRVWKGQDHVEVEWTAGPFETGREMAIRYVTNLTSDDVFYTDANGREMQPRKRNWRPTWTLDGTEPIASNYYPLTAAMYMKGSDEEQLAVLTDRSEGGSSLKSGQMEVKVLRSTNYDDNRGVGENLAETMCGCHGGYLCNCGGIIVRGTHLLSLQKGDKAAAERRRLQHFANDPLLIAYGPLPPGTPAKQMSNAPAALEAATIPPHEPMTEGHASAPSLGTMPAQQRLTYDESAEALIADATAAALTGMVLAERSHGARSAPDGTAHATSIESPITNQMSKPTSAGQGPESAPMDATSATGSRTPEQEWVGATSAGEVPPKQKGTATSASLSKTGLPPNVQLLTLKPLDDGTVLLRVAHLFQEGEDRTALSQPAAVDLNMIMPGVSFQRSTEVSLSASRPFTAVKHLAWKTGKAISTRPVDAASASTPVPVRTPHTALMCDSGCAHTQLLVELYPMEIRTFILTPLPTSPG